MDEKTFRKTLSGLPLADIRYFPQTGSTNDLALAWASDGAPDLALVYADEQTTGRGRMGRTWFTPAGSALALSLILRPSGIERENIGLFSGLGALALVGALKKYNITAEIKWPNDVLINGRKTAGILVESVWTGAQADSVVLGMGINVYPESVPPPEALGFPATCVRSETAIPVERLELLHNVLVQLLEWRPKLGSDAFLRNWEESLAFRGQAVRVETGADEMVGQVAGLEAGGSLRLILEGGEIRRVHFGEVHLRPL
jgi:BirA family transcriptional regulator, biotin operon repressor / biotin---[acetyl-CoA-carboxylase] ligase